MPFVSTVSDGSLDVRSSEPLLGGIEIMRSAQDTEVPCVASSSQRARMSVVDLEEVPRWTALAGDTHEGAALVVATHDLPSRRGRDGVR